MRIMLQWCLGTAVAAVATVATVSCRQSEMRMATVGLPDMVGERAIRIVTNAINSELWGACPQVRHDCEIDVANGIVLYHEGGQLLSRQYLKQIESCIREVGFEARVLQVGPDPLPAVPTDQGPVQDWPYRCTAMIAVDKMTANTAANIVADAIAHARVGRDSLDVRIDPARRRATIRYESLNTAFKNFEQAVAGVGYTANNTPANFGLPDAMPQGWTPARVSKTAGAD